MNQLQTQPAPAGVHRSYDALRIAVVAIVVIAALAAATRLVARPPFVERVSVVNPSSLELDLDTSDSGSGGWTPGGVAGAGATTAFAEVVDHGDTWWFRVTAGHEHATWSVPRAELARQGWRATVPTTVIGQLQGDESSPTRG